MEAVELLPTGRRLMDKMRRIDKFAAFIARTKHWKKFLFFFLLNSIAVIDAQAELMPFIILFNTVGSLLAVYVFDSWAASNILMNKIISIVRMAEFADTNAQLYECKSMLHQLKADSFNTERFSVLVMCGPMFTSTEKLLDDLEEINGK